MDAVFRIKANEFDEKLFHHLKNILGLKNNLEVTISISEQSPEINIHETKQEYFERLLKANENLEKNLSVSRYTSNQLEEFQKSLLNEL